MRFYIFYIYLDVNAETFCNKVSKRRSRQQKVTAAASGVSTQLLTIELDNSLIFRQGKLHVLDVC
jgi:hypothetical protein